MARRPGDPRTRVRAHAHSSPDPARPWDRWPCEPDKQWERFQGYLRFARIYEGGPGARGSLQAYAEAIGSPVSSVRVWASGDRATGRPSWVERARALEQSISAPPLPLAAVPRDTTAEGGPIDAPAFAREPVEAILESHARMWAEVRRLAMTSILRKIERGEELSASDAIKYAEMAVKWERLELGKVTSRRALDLSGLSDDALDALEEAAKKAERAAQEAAQGPEGLPDGVQGVRIH